MDAIPFLLLALILHTVLASDRFVCYLPSLSPLTAHCFAFAGTNSVCTQDGLLALSQTQSVRAAAFFTEMETFGRDIVDMIVTSVNNELPVPAAYTSSPFPPRSYDPNPTRISELLVPDWGRVSERDFACLHVCTNLVSTERLGWLTRFLLVSPCLRPRAHICGRRMSRGLQDACPLPRWMGT